MIRLAAVKDASRIAELCIFAKRTAYRSIFQNDAVSFNELQVLDLALHYQQSPSALEDVYVYDDGIVKGMMRWIRDVDGESAAAWELKELYIEPFFQGQGIGRALVSDFLAGAKRNNARKARLWVLEKNVAGRKFYEAQGFQPDGVKKLESGTTEYVVRYVKAL